jgi:hypothetical protein
MNPFIVSFVFAYAALSAQIFVWFALAIQHYYRERHIGIAITNYEWRPDVAHREWHLVEIWGKRVRNLTIACFVPFAIKAMML